MLIAKSALPHLADTAEECETSRRDVFMILLTTYFTTSHHVHYANTLCPLVTYHRFMC